MRSLRGPVCSLLLMFSLYSRLAPPTVWQSSALDGKLHVSLSSDRRRVSPERVGRDASDLRAGSEARASCGLEGPGNFHPFLILFVSRHRVFNNLGKCKLDMISFFVVPFLEAERRVWDHFQSNVSPRSSLSHLHFRLSFVGGTPQRLERPLLASTTHIGGASGVGGRQGSSFGEAGIFSAGLDRWSTVGRTRQAQASGGTRSSSYGDCSFPSHIIVKETRDKEDMKAHILYILPLVFANQQKVLAARSKELLGAPGIATRSDRTLLGAPGIATRSDRTLLGAPGIATRSKDVTRGSWHRY